MSRYNVNYVHFDTILHNKKNRNVLHFYFSSNCFSLFELYASTARTNL